jgi:hypothetical protein
LTWESGGGAYWIAGPRFGPEDPAALGDDPGAEPGTEPGAAGDCPVEAAGERGSPAGAPHAAQNFREPMSSAPHFAH